VQSLVVKALDGCAHIMRTFAHQVAAGAIGDNLWLTLGDQAKRRQIDIATGRQCNLAEQDVAACGRPHFGGTHA